MLKGLCDFVDKFRTRVLLFNKSRDVDLGWGSQRQIRAQHCTDTNMALIVHTVTAKVICSCEDAVVSIITALIMHPECLPLICSKLFFHSSNQLDT